MEKKKKKNGNWYLVDQTIDLIRQFQKMKKQIIWRIDGEKEYCNRSKMYGIFGFFERKKKKIDSYSDNYKKNYRDDLQIGQKRVDSIS